MSLDNITQPNHHYDHLFQTSLHIEKRYNTEEKKHVKEAEK